MRIGIITPYDSANYGAFLQAYATQKYLTSLGHEVCFLKWRSEESRKRVFFKKSHLVKDYLINLSRYSHYKANYIHMTAALELLNVTDIENVSSAKLDAVICGSDEIWNINVKNFQNTIFYGLNDSKIVNLAYAPSVGQAKISDFDTKPEIKNKLNEIKIIGVRDKKTAEIVEHVTGQLPEIVCDPTCLLTFEEYVREDSENTYGKYLLVYSYNVPKLHQQYLIRFARENHLKLLSACMYQKWCDKNVCCTPLEFCELIKHAQYVYTTTFHGSIFTLLGHKRCVISAESQKLKDLIDWTGMQSNVVSLEEEFESFCKKMMSSPNYDSFEKHLGERREKSKTLYLKALEALE